MQPTAELIIPILLLLCFFSPLHALCRTSGHFCLLRNSAQKLVVYRVKIEWMRPYHQGGGIFGPAASTTPMPQPGRSWLVMRCVWPVPQAHNNYWQGSLSCSEGTISCSMSPLSASYASSSYSADALGISGLVHRRSGCCLLGRHPTYQWRS